MIDYDALRAGLEKLTGNDFARAEREEYTKGVTFDQMLTSTRFQIRLASYALERPMPELMALPMKEYMRLFVETANFLNGASENAPGESIEG